MQLQSQPSPAPQRHVLLWLMIAVTFTLVQVRQSMHSGRLSAPPTYDDITYIEDAQRRLNLAYRQGPGAALVSVVEEPPHSPWSTALAMGAFLAFGMYEWAPAAANGLLILLVLLWSAHRCQHLKLGWQLTLAALILTWPLMGQSVVNFRPDLACGLALSWTASFVVRSRWSGAPFRQHLAAAIGFAAAFLIKPTLSPITLLVAVAALTIATARQPSRFRLRIRSSLIIAGLTAGLIAPYYILAWRQLSSYIYVQSFSEMSQIWKLELTWAEHALYYLTGPGGKLLLGSWAGLWMALAIAAGVTAIVARDQRARRQVQACTALSLLAYTLLTIPSHKNEFLGAVVPGLMLFFAIEMFVYLVSTGNTVFTGMRRKVTRVAAIGLLIAAIPTFGWPIQFTRAGHFASPREVHQHRQLLEQVYRDLVDAGTGPAYIVLTDIGPYLNAFLLEYRFGLDRFREVEVKDQSLVATQQEIDSDFAAATNILVFGHDNPNTYGWLPSRGFELQAFDRLVADPDFFLESTYPTPGRGQLFLFSRRLGFRGLRPVEGFGPIEGPYPDLGLRSPIRWGLGPATAFESQLDARRVRLLLSGRSSIADQTITVVVAGTTVGSHRFETQDRFEAIEFDFELAPDSGRIELHYSQWSLPTEADDRPLAVLFRTQMLLEADLASGENR